MSHTVERLLPLVEPVFSAIRVLASGETRPESAREVLLELLRDARAQGEKRGVTAADLDDAIYALVALADEAMLARPGSKEAWLASLLQMTLFRENTAGTGFYARLEALRRDPTRADVLLVYFVALSLGFRGRFASVDDVRRLELIECVHLDLLRAGAASEAPLAPSVRRPRTAMARQLRGRILLACGGASVLLAMGLWLVLELDLVLLVAAAVQG